MQPDGDADNGAAVESSGKVDVAIADVPADVIAAAKARLPELTITEAESEIRDSRRYFDIGGTMPDGSEVELDMMEESGNWRVVETQRDVKFDAIPAPARAAALARDATLQPTRVIESRQEDGLIIYELFAAQGSDPQGRKLEVSWDGSKAEALTREWAH